MCDKKKIDDEEKEKIIRFALHLANIANSSYLKTSFSPHHQMINDTKHLLGQLIFLINQSPDLAIEAVNEPNDQLILGRMKETFENKILDICQRLQNHYLLHEATQLQDPNIALHTKIPFEIGRALLNETGTINTGIIDFLSDIFLTNDTCPVNYEINLSHGLTLLQRSPKLRSEFEQIYAPNSPNSPSIPVIRATLGLSPYEEIGFFETRLTALIAILSHLRQGNDRSCFAVSLAIEILSSHLGFCMKDLRQLLVEGKLTRRVKEVKKDIPFMRKINDENLKNEVTFNRAGEILIQDQVQGTLWEAPGLNSAFQTLGAGDLKKIVQIFTEKHFSETEKESSKIEIRVLIMKLCEELILHNFSDSSLYDLYTEACFAFSSETTQPLLKIWENAIANISEVSDAGMIKSSILDSTLHAFYLSLQQSSVPPTPILEEFLQKFYQVLAKNIQLQYDPMVTQGQRIEDGEPVEWGFVLYSDQHQIKNENEFRQFLGDLLQNVKKSIKKENGSKQNYNSFRQIIKILAEHLKSTKFILNLLSRYHPSNKKIIDDLPHDRSLNLKQLKFTPWLTQTGNNSKSLLEMYLESEKSISAERFIASGAQEALTNIIEMCKQMSPQEKENYIQNPNKLTPLCILGKHRLPFMAGNLSLANAWQKECPTQVWIDNVVITPGERLAESPMNHETKENFIAELETLFPRHFPQETIPLILERIYHIQGESLSDEEPQEVSIQDYRNQVLGACLEIGGLSKSAVERLTRQIDTALCSSLTPDLKKILTDSAVHFADTNWSKDIQDLHFCFAVNPGTGKLELWEIESDGTHLTALDQNYWFFNQKWEFLVMPEDLIPDDSTILDTQ